MNKYSIIVFVLTLTSCQFTKYDKVNFDDVLEKEISNINWQEVDNYPSFQSCDSLYDSVDRVNCFYFELHNRIIDNLSLHNVVSNRKISDTMYVFFVINHFGKLDVLKVDVNNKIETGIPNIALLVKESVSQIDDVIPAYKRGQPVKIALEMPLLITNKD